MPKRKSRYPEKPWAPDPARWQKLVGQVKQDGSKMSPPTEPKGGWQLWRLDTLEDAPQNERL